MNGFEVTLKHLRDLQKLAWPNDQAKPLKQQRDELFSRLAEEVGELAKATRAYCGRSFHPGEVVRLKDVEEEAGDVLVLTLRICDAFGIDHGRAIKATADKIEGRLRAAAPPDVAAHDSVFSSWGEP